MKHWLVIGWMVAWLVVGVYASSLAGPLKDTRVLVLHSYSTDYSWTRGLHEGVMEVLQEMDWTARSLTEYMDTKNHYSPAYLKNLYVLYKEKYADVAVDGIIVTDNNALNFMLEHGPELFPGVPVVGCGINYIEAVPEYPWFVGIVAEQGDHLGTMQQALRQNPDATSIFVIGDRSTTGEAIMAATKKALVPLENQISIVYMPPMAAEELERFVASRDPRDIVYLLPYLRDAKGVAYSEHQIPHRLALVSKVPIYVSWSFQLNTGVTGGDVVSSRKQGAQAARYLLDHLQGNRKESFVVSGDAALENIYDYSALNRYGITENMLPTDVRYINKPVSFFHTHRAVLLPGAGIVFVLLAVLVLVSLNLKKQRIINHSNARLMSMDKEIIETQRELVATLGEVIEVRSQETGNHVKRVAKMSRLIGEKIGMSENHLDMLEAASPMHDVGKIGIPEAILHKPGALDKEEFEIIKCHTVIGKSILDSSDKHLLHVASTLAHQHHERWDGTGYPCGLQGENIALVARITMLADVYDALSSDRVYKKAWPEDKIIAYIKQESGKHFDPELVRVLLDNLEEVRRLRQSYAPESLEDVGCPDPMEKLRRMRLDIYCDVDLDAVADRRREEWQRAKNRKG